MLRHLKLENYRNHCKFELVLDKVTVLVGKNGVGKSNVLEAISVLSSCRSFREEDKRNLVNSDCAFGRVQGDNLEVFIQKEPISLMKVKENGIIKKQSAFVGLLKSVVFSPETMALATGSPKIRRKFLDLMVSQKDRDYLASLIDYEKIKVQRNSLLQRIRDGAAYEDELDFWDEGLVKEGKAITKKREQAISFLNNCIGEIYRNISGVSTDSLDITYQKALENLDLLKENHQKEIWQGRTLFGPHRDDFLINLNNRSAASFASRGEARSVILALKMGELKFLDNEENEPILLLDDVFSEFDEIRRSHLGKLISDYQTVITTTDKGYLSGWPMGQAKIIEI
jgi:DNA replication and repair protein RecF